jgi:hypothetical protein
MFITGPVGVAEPLYSFDVREFEHYGAESIVDAIRSFPGTRLLHPPEPRWEDWQAAWEANSRMMLLDNLYTFDDTNEWGELRVTCDCLLEDLLGLWGTLRKRHPGVWLMCNTERMYSPTSFLSEWVAVPENATDRSP